MRLILFQSFILFFIIESVSASSCDPRSFGADYAKARLDSRVKEIYNNQQFLGPVKDQDSVGWCYSFAGSDLLTHYLQKKGLLQADQIVSPVNLAILTQGRVAQMVSNAGIMAQVYVKNGIGDQKIREAQQKIEKLDERFAGLQDKQQKTDDLLVKKHPAYARSEDLLRQMDAEPQNTKLVEEYNRLLATMYQDVREEPASKALQDQFDLTVTERSFYEELMKYIQRLQRNPLADSFAKLAEGGLIKDAFIAGWGQLCLESELSHKSNDQWDLMTALTEVASFVYSPQKSEEGCQQVMGIIEQICPGVEESGILQLVNMLVTPENVWTSPLRSLIVESCQNKDFLKEQKMPQVMNFEFPQISKKELFERIDEQLSHGDIVGIDYVFEALIDGVEMPLGLNNGHASSIVGKVSVCDEDYYILRNSYGQEACQSSYGLASTSREDRLLLEDMIYECAEKLYDEFLVHTPAELLNQKLKNEKWGEFQEQCTLTIHLSSEKQKKTFLCDEKGNFIVPKELMSKALSGITVVHD